MFKPKLRFCGLTTLTLVIVTACATQPEYNAELEAAKQVVASAESDPLSQQAASGELEEAKESLAAAEGAFRSDASPETIRYHAYMATRYAEIVKERAADSKIREQIENASAKSGDIVLAARTSQVAALSRELEALKAKQTERGAVLTLGDVLFDTDKAQLKPGAQVTIDKLASYLLKYPQQRILVEGHTDSRGTDTYNQDLALRRANAVGTALYSRGVSRDRVSVRSLGELYPVASNDSAAGRQQNRRVEVVISDKDGSFPAAAKR